MKLHKSTIVFVAASSIALLLSSEQVFAKTGLVDMQTVFQSPAIQQLMKLKNIDQTTLQTAYKHYQYAQTKANKAKGPKKKALEAKAKIARTKFQSLMEKEQSTALAQQKMLQAKITAAIAKVSKEKGMSTTLLKQVVLYSAPGEDTDITSDVVAMLNKEK